MDAQTMGNVLLHGLQTACVAAAAGGIVWLLRVESPSVRYACWRGVLLFCLLLPWLQERAPVVPAPDTRFASAGVAATVGVMTVATELPAAVPGDVAASGVPWQAALGLLLIGGVVVRLGWLGLALVRLRQLRMAGEPAPSGGVHDEWQSAMQVRAHIRYVPGLGQPVTFGLRHPVILLPGRLRDEAVAMQRAVVCHELCHVRRRDWAWLMAEELVRAALWFNPAIWWIISRIQRSREEVVDALTVRRTQERRAYAEALLAFAGAPRTAVATAFSRNHLYRRIVLVSKERAMSARRMMVSYTVTAIVVAVCGWHAAALFPLVETLSAQAQELRAEPGPLERAARPVTPENPVPGRISVVPAHYPEEAADSQTEATVTLRAVVGADGTVAEISNPRVALRPAGAAAGGTGASVTGLEEVFTRAAVTALRGWRYAPPAEAPIVIDVTFVFGPGMAEAMAAQSAPGVSAGRVPASAPPARVVEPGGRVRPPSVVRDVKPAYTAEAMRARVQGGVLVEARVEPDGRVSHARVVRSLPLLNEQALDAVMQWQFTPALEDGAPVPVLVTVELDFTLR